jgi:Taurine catabolism dioxygenase TauD, TfdA family
MRVPVSNSLSLDLRAMASPDAVADCLLDACQTARIVHVRTHPQAGLQREFWEAVITRHGLQVSVDENAATGEPTGALWSDVEFDPAAQRYFRHSNSAQPLHTDGSYIGRPPEVVFLICRRAATIGGATVFLDGEELFGILHTDAPDLLRALMHTPLRFEKGAGAVEAPFVTEHNGELSFRWNYYALDRNQSATALNLATRLQSLLLQLVAQRRTQDYLLRPTEAVFFSDASVLHGREAFIARQRGERCLWKGGLTAPAASIGRVGP